MNKIIFNTAVIVTALGCGLSAANASHELQTAHFYGVPQATASHTAPYGSLMGSGYHVLHVPAGTFGNHPDLRHIIHESVASANHPESIVQGYLGRSRMGCEFDDCE